MNTDETCRHCGQSLAHSLVDLGLSPPCNTLVAPEDLGKPEIFYPLHARVCSSCFLVQVGDSETPQDIFSEYSYFSSYSESWVAHAKKYVLNAIERFSLTPENRVFEVASNDGYLLQHFLPAQIPVLGIEPALNVAEVARSKGIPTVNKFLGETTAQEITAEHGQADLVAANNVMAHTPYLNDFVAGLAQLAKTDGVVTVEFPHLMCLMDETQFDTIYHEHFSYFSFFSVEKIFLSKGLHIFDVEKLSTHGGSLRIYASQSIDAHPVGPNVHSMRTAESEWGVDQLDTYTGFTEKVEQVKRDLLLFLVQARKEGKRVVGYGAPGKGNTLLNYCGIRTDLLDYLVDLNPYKQGKYTPGTRIPIHAPEQINATKPDYVLVMPWNLLDEITSQMNEVRSWGGKFVIAIPGLRII